MLLEKILHFLGPLCFYSFAAKILNVFIEDPLVPTLNRGMVTVQKQKARAFPGQTDRQTNKQHSCSQYMCN